MGHFYHMYPSLSRRILRDAETPHFLPPQLGRGGFSLPIKGRLNSPLPTIAGGSEMSVRLQNSPIRSPGYIKRTSEEGIWMAYDNGFLASRVSSARCLNMRLGLPWESSSLEWNPVGRA